MLELVRAFEAPAGSGSIASAPGLNLLPAGCHNPDEAIEELLESIHDQDIRDLDQQIQEMIVQQFTSLVEACTTSANVFRSLEDHMRRLAEAFVAGRLTAANVVDMFLAHYPDEDAAAGEIANAYHEAVPEMARSLSCPEPEIRILALPPGESAAAFRTLVRKALPNIPLAITESADDVIFYREQPGLPLDQLPLLGPAAQKVYGPMTSGDNFTFSSREDIAEWAPKTE
jgi:hypothetical protein